MEDVFAVTDSRDLWELLNGFLKVFVSYLRKSSVDKGDSLFVKKETRSG